MSHQQHLITYNTASHPTLPSQHQQDLTSNSQWTYTNDGAGINAVGPLNYTEIDNDEQKIREIEEMLMTNHQQSGERHKNEELKQVNNLKNSYKGEVVSYKGEVVKDLATSPSNFLDEDIKNILSNTSFLHDDTPQQIKGDYHITSETLSEKDIVLSGIKIASWTFKNIISDSDFENLLDIFRNVDRLIEGKHLSKKEYIQRIQLLGLMIKLKWKIFKPAMQVKVWRLMERKLACRKIKMTNKDV